jgi:hypothetical protein
MQRHSEGEALSRLGQAHPVVAVDRIEGRDVELLLGLGATGAVRAHDVTVRAAVGVVDLGDHAGERAVLVVAPEQRERVEDITERAGIRQHRHPTAAQLDAALGEQRIDVVSDAASRIAQMVAGLEARERTQRAGQSWQVVDVDEPLIAAVPHPMPYLAGPHVRDVDLVEIAHHSTPRLAAASTPDRQPSSWKPQPW